MIHKIDLMLAMAKRVRQLPGYYYYLNTLSIADTLEAKSAKKPYLQVELGLKECMR